WCNCIGNFSFIFLMRLPWPKRLLTINLKSLYYIHMRRKTFILTLLIAALACMAFGIAIVCGESGDDTANVILVLKNNEEKTLDGCRVDGPYFCNENNRFCVHENNITALKGNSSRCGGTGIIGNLRQTKGLIQEVSDSAGINDWFRKACEIGIRKLNSFSAITGQKKIDSDKLESISAPKGSVPTKSEINEGKTFTLTFEANYSDNKRQQYNCRINTRAWIYYIYPDMM
ncbi:MAG: hypothetical protein L7F77_16760, partial [Candidatus Magnetominusculus sp. LBB02]|nr:hypothetical protein [Candidatus Magnetominusculus sp. LBB02]